MAGSSVRTVPDMEILRISRFPHSQAIRILSIWIHWWKEGLLYKEECEQLQCGGDPRFVDYERIYFSRNEILRKAYERFACG